MARSFQTLQVTYWESAMALSPDEKLVELFLMLNRNCECSGLQQMHPGTIAKYLGMTEKQVDKALKDLEKRGRIGRCDGDWIIVPGKWEHQQRKTGQAETALQNSLETAPTRLQVIFHHYLEKHSCLVDDNKTTTTQVQDGSTCIGNREKGVVNTQKGINSAKAGGCNIFVAKWIDLCKEIRSIEWNPTKADIGQIKNMFNHVKGDMESFETAAHNYLSSEFVKNPTPAKLYASFETYRTGGGVPLGPDEYDPEAPGDVDFI